MPSAVDAVAASAPPRFVRQWMETLQTMAFHEAAPDPAAAAIFSTDMIAAFLTLGALSSERVGALATPVATLFQQAHEYGVRHFVLLQDTHHPETPEFDAWPPHAIQGTAEAETIPELKRLPFAASFEIFEKNSLHPALGTGFDAWLDRHAAVQTAIVVGNCTDLCVYHLAMHLRLRANAHHHAAMRVILPANGVDTYDLGAAAAKSGAMAHPGDFFHQVFLYHLALNGIEVVRKLTP